MTESTTCGKNTTRFYLSQTNGALGSSSAKHVDPKAVGSQRAHLPLSRRCSIPSFTVAEPSSLATILGSSDSLSSLRSSQTSLGHVVNAPSEVKRGHRKLDRSQSEPAQRAAAALSSTAACNANRYKTELCRPFEENGSCKYGDKCQFAHGFHELRSLSRHPKYKTELCKTYHTVGFCPYGPRCHFIHNAEEARTQSGSNGLSRANKPGSFKILPGSTSDSPSPPSSLSESPTSSSGFFSDNDLYSLNPFSPTSKGFQLGSCFLGGHKSANLLNELAGMHVMLPDLLDPPSLSDSLASDLDSLSLGSNSPPPTMITTPMETSRGLRLPIFSRISERLDE